VRSKAADPNGDLTHAGLAMEPIRGGSDLLVDKYFSLQVADNLMPQSMVAQGVVNMNLPSICPVPLPSWAPYLMDSKIPHQALEICLELFATMTNVADITRATPMSDWLRAPCVRLGPNAMDRHLSLLNQGFEPTAPGAKSKSNKVDAGQGTSVPESNLPQHFSIARG
jgi:hypothetical protein